MLLIKITILFVYVALIWSFLFSNKLKNDMNFNVKINVDHQYPKWCYAMAIWDVITFVLITCSLVYILFWVWQ